MVKSILTHKKSQVWGFDLIIGVTIFAVGILIFFIYSLNKPGEAEESIKKLSYNGNLVSESVLSEGYPENWNSANVIVPGILTGNKINNTKLEELYLLADSDYTKTKSLFNIRENYYILLSEKITLSFGEVDGIGLEPMNPKNLIKINRFTIYNDKPVNLYIYIWE